MWWLGAFVILGMFVTAGITVHPAVRFVIPGVPAGTEFVPDCLDIEFVTDFLAEFVTESFELFVDEALSVTSSRPVPRMMMGSAATADALAARATVKIKTFIISPFSRHATPKRHAAQTESEFVTCRAPRVGAPYLHRAWDWSGPNA
jgi:hypothetical protein